MSWITNAVTEIMTRRREIDHASGWRGCTNAEDAAAGWADEAAMLKEIIERHAGAGACTAEESQ